MTFAALRSAKTAESRLVWRLSGGHIPVQIYHCIQNGFPSTVSATVIEQQSLLVQLQLIRPMLNVPRFIGSGLGFSTGGYLCTRMTSGRI